MVFGQEEKPPTVNREKYNADGTINTKYVKGGPVGEGMDSDMDRGLAQPSNADLRTMRLNSQDRRRDKDRQERADQAMSLKNKRAKAGQRTKAEVHFAPYVDHVRTAKDKAKKKLKEAQKKSYYDGSKK